MKSVPINKRLGVEPRGERSYRKKGSQEEKKDQRGIEDQGEICSQSLLEKKGENSNFRTREENEDRRGALRKSCGRCQNEEDVLTYVRRREERLWPEGKRKVTKVMFVT